MYSLKIHNEDNKKVIGICDIDLIGLSFEEDENILNVYESFFNGESANLDDIINHINDCDSAHIVGNNITNQLIKKEIIKKSNCKVVCDINHSMIFKM
jgi:hypothetical protein